MAVDAGARQIYDLLNKKTPSLNEDLAKIARAARTPTRTPTA